MPIEEGIEPVKTKVYSFLHGLGPSVFIYDAELVPYVNGVSLKRDPMVRRIDNKANFLHLSTIKSSCPQYEFEVENRDGGRFRFGAGGVIKQLYGEDDFDY